MKRACVAAALLLAGCGARHDAAAAEEELRIVRRDGGYADQCAALRKVADAWLRARDEARHRDAVQRRDVACYLAESNARLGLPDRPGRAGAGLAD